MKRLLFLSIISTLINWANSCKEVPLIESHTPPPSYTDYSHFLTKYVSPNGLVDYLGIKKDDGNLNKILEEFSQTYPNENWTREDSLAYWINVYNAYTIKIIVDNYPLKSIREIDSQSKNPMKSVWDISFIEIMGSKFSLSDIEHLILRKEFDESRIHFAIVCASKSCPDLLDEAYIPSRLEDQLQKQSIRFLNDTSKNKFEGKVMISSIFNWFEDDFTKKSSLINYINQFLKKPIPEDLKFGFKEYDWKLNEYQD